MINETELLEDIKTAENNIAEILHTLSKKYPTYGFDMASTKQKFETMLETTTSFIVDIQCHLERREKL